MGGRKGIAFYNGAKMILQVVAVEKRRLFRFTIKNHNTHEVSLLNFRVDSRRKRILRQETEKQRNRDGETETETEADVEKKMDRNTERRLRK